MKSNVGGVDRTLRIVVGLVAVYLGYSASGILSYVGYGVAALMLATGALGWCGLYGLFGVSTCPTKKVG